MADLEESIKGDTFKRTIDLKRAAFDLIGSELVAEDSATINLPNGGMAIFTKEIGYPPSTAGEPGDRYFGFPQISAYQDSVSLENRIPDGDNVINAASLTLGDLGIGVDGNGTIENLVRGSKFTSGRRGFARSVSVYLNVSTAAHNVKCAIYEYISDGNAGSLVAETEEKSISPSVGWQTFNIAGSVLIKENTTYYILAWSNATTGNCLVPFDLETDKGFFDTRTYNGWPNPFTGEVSDNGRFSIYLTMTPFANYNLTNWVDWGSTDSQEWEIHWKTVIINRSGSTQTIILKTNLRRISKGNL